MYPPYYIVPDVETYKSLDPESEEAKKLSRKIVANIGDLFSLRQILGIDPPEFAKFYPDMEAATPSTLDTIDAFLDKFGNNNTPAGYVPEPLEELPVQEPELASKDTGMSHETQIESNDSFKDWDKLIKERKYREALQLIEAQNLNNPQKSIYFAHQIRFLKKLISIENFKNKTKG